MQTMSFPDDESSSDAVYLESLLVDNLYFVSSGRDYPRTGRANF